ncbi:50S ribosomal protein L29 [Nitrospirota bacterium]
MKASELREMTVEELRGNEQDLRKELFNLRFQAATGEIQNPARMGTVRREIARVLSVITEKNSQATSEVAK